MKNKSFAALFAGLIVLAVTPMIAQTDATAQPGTSMPANATTQSDTTQRVQPTPVATVPEGMEEVDITSVRMLVPPPVSGQVYRVGPETEERANYVRGGLAFTTAHSDNVLTSTTGTPVGDTSFSIAPMLDLEETTPRMHLLLSYAPGFTFYQHTSGRNEADQNVAFEFEYRLSPHVTLSARDSFQKSSSVFNQPGVPFVESVSGGAQGANFSVIAPIADVLNNFGDIGLTYQFSPNSMVGVSGTFSNLHYPNPEQVTGLYDASSQAGSAFYSHRIARRHYVGAMYQYQRLLSSPTAGSVETQTNAVFGFYTFYPTARLSISLFGGPQHASTVQPTTLPSLYSWSPAAGASVGWRAAHSSFAFSYEHVVASGGGLLGAVQIDNATASFRQQITKTFAGSLAAGYVENDVIGTLPGAESGHSIFGTASIGQQFGTHVIAQLGYTRLRQTYNNIPAISLVPVTNREYVSLMYVFQHPLGK